MTDIVERLRNSWAVGAQVDLLPEAAAEIERLRAEKTELLAKRNNEEMQKMIDYWGKRCEKAEAEVERLRAERDKLRNKDGLAG